MLRQRKKTTCHNRLSIATGLAYVGLMLAASQALAIETASELLMRGEAILLRAQSETGDQTRDQHLSDAVDILSQAYGLGRRQVKIRALIGAAQGYLAMRKAPARFPFLWSAPPLPRAIKSLQHVLALQPDNTAANLLMAIALWRQAASSPSTDAHQHPSEPYLRQVRAAGLRARLPTDKTPSANETPPVGFTIGDTILALRYVDARGTGRAADLILIYARGSESHCFGVVVSGGSSYPLVSNAVTGEMAKTTRLTALTIDAEAAPHSMVSVTWEAPSDTNRIDFTWSGTSFQMATPATARQ